MDHPSGGARPKTRSFSHIRNTELPSNKNCRTLSTKVSSSRREKSPVIEAVIAADENADMDMNGKQFNISQDHICDNIEFVSNISNVNKEVFTVSNCTLDPDAQEHTNSKYSYNNGHANKETCSSRIQEIGIGTITRKLSCSELDHSQTVQRSEYEDIDELNDILLCNAGFIENGSNNMSRDTEKCDTMTNERKVGFRDVKMTYKPTKRGKVPESGIDVMKESLKERWKRSGLALRKFLSDKLGFGNSGGNKAESSVLAIDNKQTKPSNGYIRASGGNVDSKKMKRVTKMSQTNNKGAKGLEKQTSTCSNINRSLLTSVDEQSETDYAFTSGIMSGTRNSTSDTSRGCIGTCMCISTQPNIDACSNTNSRLIHSSDTSLSDAQINHRLLSADTYSASSLLSTGSASGSDSSPLHCDRLPCDSSSHNHSCMYCSSDWRVTSPDSNISSKYRDEKPKCKPAFCDIQNTADMAELPNNGHGQTGPVEEMGRKGRRDIRKKMSRMVRRCKLKRRQKQSVGVLDSELMTSSDECPEGSLDKVPKNQRSMKCMKNGRLKANTSAPTESSRSPHSGSVSEGTSQILPGLRYALPYLPERFRRSLQTSQRGQDAHVIHTDHDILPPYVLSEDQKNLAKYSPNVCAQEGTEFPMNNTSSNRTNGSLAAERTGRYDYAKETSGESLSNPEREQTGLDSKGKGGKPKSSIARKMRLNLVRHKSKKDRKGTKEENNINTSFTNSDTGMDKNERDSLFQCMDNNIGNDHYSLFQCMDNNIDNDAHSWSTLVNEIRDARSEGDDFPRSRSFGSGNRTNGEISASIFGRSCERDYHGAMFNRTVHSSTEDLIENLDIPFANDPLMQFRDETSHVLDHTSDSPPLPLRHISSQRSSAFPRSESHGADVWGIGDSTGPTIYNSGRVGSTDIDDIQDSGLSVNYSMLGMLTDLVERMDGGVVDWFARYRAFDVSLTHSMENNAPSESTSDPGDDLPRSASTPSDIHNSRSGSLSDHCGEADDEFECECEHCLLLRQPSTSDPDPELDLSARAESVGDTRSSGEEYWNLGAVNELWVPSGYGEENVTTDMMELTSLDLMLMAESSLRLDIMLENVIQQMLAVQPDLLSEQAAPPAPISVIDNLTTVNLTVEDIEQHPCCPICLCPSELDDVMSMLPCQHIFHPLCIQAWLEKSGTCPVCRSGL